jgi:uncharacterized membrane protein
MLKVFNQISTHFIYLFIRFILFDALVYVTQQIGLLIAASRPIIALFRPYVLVLIGFQAILLLLQQN